MGGGKIPGPSKEENALKRQQADLLKQQGDILQEQIRRQDLLAPILFRQAGLVPTYGDIQKRRPTGGIDGITGQPLYEDYTERGIIGFEEGPPTPEQLAAKREAELLEEQYNIDRIMRPAQLEAMGYKGIFDESGKLTGIEKAPLSENDQLRQEAETEFLKRQRAALRGELPVAPGLIRDLDSQQRLLQERMRQQLGTGWETSTAGIQAQGEYMSRRNDALEAARRGDLASAGQLAQAANERIYEARDNAFTAAQILGTPSVQTAASLSGLAAGGRTSANLSQLLGVINPGGALGVGGGGGGGAGTLGSLAEQLGTLSGQLGATRIQNAQLQNQQKQQRRAQAGAIGGAAGGVIGGIIGAIPTFGIGAGAGAAIGGALGSGIGYGAAG